MNYSKIKHYDIANGEGIRISLFISGCQFHCKGCFNPETWDYSYGREYTAQTERDILSFVSSPNIDGLSILGGDPLWQNEEDIEQLVNLTLSVRKLNKTVWIWSGFTWEQLYYTVESPIILQRRQLIESCNVFVDGRFEEDKRDLRLQWRGSSNQRVIDVDKSIKSNKIILYK